MTWLVLFVGFFVICWIYDRYSNRRLYKLSKALPGFKPWPIIGSAHLLVKSSEGLWVFLKQIGEVALKNNGLYSGWMGPYFCCAVTDPEDIENILSTCLRKSVHYKFGRVFVGDGLMTARDTLTWRRHRKALQPSFNKHILNSFVGILNAKSMDLVRQLKIYAGKGTMDIYHLVAITTLDGVCETIMETSIEEADKHKKVPLHEALKEVLTMGLYRALRFWLWIDALYYLTAHGKLFRQYLDIVRKLPSDVLLKIRNRLTRKSEHELNENYLSAKKNSEHGFSQKVFLNQILDSTAQFTDQEIYEEVTTIILTGYESTALTTCFALQVIGSNPDVQQNIVEELNSIFGHSKRPISKEDLTNMTYLENTIKETMRLYPAAPVFGREVEHDLKLKHHTIPAGTSAYILAFSVHTDESIWGPDVLKFVPERWMPENSRKRHPCSYLPFSYGVRNCIGLQYAMMSMKIFLANVLRSYLVKSDMTNMAVGYEVVIRPTKGHLIQVEERRRNLEIITKQHFN